MFVEDVGGGHFGQHDLTDRRGCFVLDSGATRVWVWVGPDGGGDAAHQAAGGGSGVGAAEGLGEVRAAENQRHPLGAN